MATTYAHALKPTSRLRRATLPPMTAKSQPAAAAQVREVLHGLRLQTKLTVGPTDDVFEREADRVAGDVMRMPEPVESGGSSAGPPAMAASPPAPPAIQRLCPECEDEMQRQPLEEPEEEPEQALQSKAMPGHTPQVTPDLEPRLGALHGSGSPLPSAERDFFEPRFGSDFGDVRIHTGSEATDLARRVEARAFTLGRSVVFGPGEYRPGTEAGRRLLAHELTHVVQQGGGSTPDTVQRRSPADTAVYDPHPTDEKRGFRAEDLARLTASGGQLTFTGSLSPLSGDVQKLLLDNIAATVRFALDPQDPGRIAELQGLRDYLEKNPQKGPFFDKPAERIDFTDLYHGHVCVPQSVLNNSAQLEKLRKAVEAKEWTVKEGIEAAIGMATPTTRPQAQKVMAVVGPHRQTFLDIVAPLLQTLASMPEAGVLYHSWENVKPRIGDKRMESSHPIRRILTPLSTHRPKFQLEATPHCAPLINFSFHVDRSGRITLLPGASAETVRAFEILHDAFVPATPAKTIQAPPAIQRLCPECEGEMQRKPQRATALGDRLQSLCPEGDKVLLTGI